ncbi:MAG: hypothetical protein JST94_08570 [Bacteroidetes bacterium]|nr:hypothetical protein [Bacteroidota bacterium]
MVDIDNTIADSWHSLMPPYIWPNEQERIKSLATFIGMNFFLTTILKNNNNQVIFFSARSIFSYKTTCNWLKSNGLITNNNQVVITRTASTKYFFIKNIFFKVKKIIYIDDLSHKHETGQIVLFENVLRNIKKLARKNTSIIYLGIPFIEKINKNYDKNIEEIASDFILYSEN